MLTISSEGTLKVLNGTNTTIWSSSSSTSLKNPVAQLLDTGNFVIKTENDPDPAHFYWQSFHFPDSTLLPGMKIGKNLANGLDWSFNSWKSNDDPSLGNFRVKLDISGYPQLFLCNGSARYIRNGPWNGERFSGIPTPGSDDLFLISYKKSSLLSTYSGYMSPEYAIEGAFSVKSDVYSFGVLLIEIVSGKKSRFFNHPGHNLNLMGHAWTRYKEDRLSELIDKSIVESSDKYEADSLNRMFFMSSSNQTVTVVAPR
ncbi:hypothetical protein AgCh_018462 [Apium graveolens]